MHFRPPIFLCALGCGVFVTGLKRVMRGVVPPCFRLCAKHKNRRFYGLIAAG